MRAEDWRDELHLHLRAAPGAPFLTRATAAYPAGLNDLLAEALLEATARHTVKQPAAEKRACSPLRQMVKMGRWGNALVRVADQMYIKEPSCHVGLSMPLEGPTQASHKTAEEARALGGLKDTASATSKLPSVVATWSKLRELLVNELREDPDTPIGADYVEPEEMEFADPQWRRIYEAVEADEHAWEEVQRLVKLGYLRQCDNLEQCARLTGADPVVSKFGLVIKEKNGKTKRRLILDSKESGVTQCAKKNQRILLPTVISLVFDLLAIGHKMAPGTNMEILVLDISDAFWTLGLRPSERKFFVGRLRGKFFVHMRLAQGSRGAPLAWCRFFALMARLTQALLTHGRTGMEVYVDDPAVVIAGTQQERDIEVAIIVLAWRAINLRLAFQKGQRGRAVEWTGCRILVNKKGVAASLKQEACEELKAIIKGMLGTNVVPFKALRSLAGKLSNAARLLTAWRPFIGEIWAALSAAEKPSKTLRSAICRAQIDHAMRWLWAFLLDFEGALTRPFAYTSFLASPSQVRVTVDASPYGFGAVLEEQHSITEYFSEAISSDDVDVPGIEVGAADHQQVLEELGALIALRAWRAKWRRKCAQLTARGDNMTMLVMLLDLKGSTKVLSLIAREMALEVASACYKPILVEHVPGFANKTADQLCRQVDVIPPSVAGARRIIPPRHDRAHYRTLSLPSGSASPEASEECLEASRIAFQ